jgi:hypothetical protein
MANDDEECSIPVELAQTQNRLSPYAELSRLPGSSFT